MLPRKIPDPTQVYNLVYVSYLRLRSFSSREGVPLHVQPSRGVNGDLGSDLHPSPPIGDTWSGGQVGYPSVSFPSPSSSPSGAPVSRAPEVSRVEVRGDGRGEARITPV